MKHLILVMSKVWQNRHAEYNEWYDQIHVPHMLTIPGVVAAQRFQAGPALPDVVDESPYRYLTLYEIDTDDLHHVLHLMAADKPTMVISPAIDGNDIISYAYTALTERVEDTAP